MAFLRSSDVGLDLVLRRKAKTTHGVPGAEKNVIHTADDKQNGSASFGIAVSVRKVNQNSRGSQTVS